LEKIFTKFIEKTSNNAKNLKTLKFVYFGYKFFVKTEN